MTTRTAGTPCANRWMSSGSAVTTSPPWYIAHTATTWASTRSSVPTLPAKRIEPTSLARSKSVSTIETGGCPDVPSCRDRDASSALVLFTPRASSAQTTAGTNTSLSRFHASFSRARNPSEGLVFESSSNPPASRTIGWLTPRCSRSIRHQGRQMQLRQRSTTPPRRGRIRCPNCPASVRAPSDERDDRRADEAPHSRRWTG